MTNKQKPVVQLTGQDGNVFNLLGICTKALNRAGMRDEAKELSEKIWGCESYNAALTLMHEYVEVQ